MQQGRKGKRIIEERKKQRGGREREREKKAKKLKLKTYKNGQ